MAAARSVGSLFMAEVCLYSKSQINSARTRSGMPAAAVRWIVERFKYSGRQNGKETLIPGSVVLQSSAMQLTVEICFQPSVFFA